MRIATWNINGLRARFEFLVHWLRAREPDVVGLQELKLEEGLFPHAELEAEGYRAVVHSQKAWNGVAVLTRGDVEPGDAGLPGQEDFGARLVSASLPDLDFVTVYCPNGKSVDHADYPRKLAWFEALTGHLEASRSPDRPLVVGGDFNICPTELDTWNEERYAGRIFHTDDERTRFRRVLDLGLTDLYRHHQPTERKFSWWDYRHGAFHRNMGLRIDFLLGTSSVVDRLRSVEIDRDYRKKKDGLTASDHAPVIAELA